MPRDNRVKRARRIAATLGLSRVESPPKASTQPRSAALLVARSGGSGSTLDLAAPQPLPIQPPTIQPSPTQPQLSQLPTNPHTVGSSVAPASEIPSRVRGVTRGKNVTKLRRQMGHNIPVPIPISNHRPEGEHAPSLVNHLGLAIREVALVRPYGWKKLDNGIKLAVITTVQSKKAQESRAKLPYNHTGCSRSFASRLSLMTAQNAGQAPPITQFFRDREKSNQWVNEVAQQIHEALVQWTEEQS